MTSTPLFDPTVPLNLHHEFTVAPGWTVEPAITGSFKPIEADNAPVLTSATLTMRWSF